MTDCNNLATAISGAQGGTVQIQGILTCTSPITISTSVTLAGASSNQALDGFDGGGATNLFVVKGSGTQVSFNYLTFKNAKPSPASVSEKQCKAFFSLGE